MKLEDYISAIEIPLEVGRVREINLSDLYEHFKKGDFTPQQVLEFYRKRDSPRFIELANLYGAGKLFKAQTQSFDSWCMADFAKEDKKKAEEYLSIEDSAQMNDEAIKYFIMTRVFGKRIGASLDDNVTAKNAIREAWIKQNKFQGWGWRE